MYTHVDYCRYHILFLSGFLILSTFYFNKQDHRNYISYVNLFLSSFRVVFLERSSLKSLCRFLSASLVSLPQVFKSSQRRWCRCPRSSRSRRYRCPALSFPWFNRTLLFLTKLTSCFLFHFSIRPFIRHVRLTCLFHYRGLERSSKHDIVQHPRSCRTFWCSSAHCLSPRSSPWCPSLSSCQFQHCDLVLYHQLLDVLRGLVVRFRTRVTTFGRVPAACWQLCCCQTHNHGHGCTAHVQSSSPLVQRGSARDTRRVLLRDVHQPPRHLASARELPDSWVPGRWSSPHRLLRP